MDWTSEAQTAVNYTGTDLYEAHRGAIPSHVPGVMICFGNGVHAAVLVTEDNEILDGYSGYEIELDAPIKVVPASASCTDAEKKVDLRPLLARIIREGVRTLFVPNFKRFRSNQCKQCYRSHRPVRAMSQPTSC